MQLETARAFRLPAGQRLARLIIPAALPKFFAGLRLGLSLALILMVFAELAGQQQRHRLRDEQRGDSFDMTGVWATLVLLGILGNLLNANSPWPSAGRSPGTRIARAE